VTTSLEPSTKVSNDFRRNRISNIEKTEPELVGRYERLSLSLKGRNRTTSNSACESNASKETRR
jgi:hypothetical protein